MGLGEKKTLETRPLPIAFSGPQHKRRLREVPFTKPTYHMLCKALQVHRSILRAILRSDVPSFSCERVQMGTPSLGK